MTALLATWALLLAGALLVFPPLGPVSSLVLVVIAWRQARGAGRYARLIATGMTLGFLGDLAMAGGVVLAGMLLFGVGHVCYIAAMLRDAEGGRGVRIVTWLAALALGACIWSTLALSGSRAAQMPVVTNAALAYTLLLASTFGVAMGLAIRDPSRRLLALGALLFLASDSILGARMFSPEIYEAFPEVIRAKLVWLTYGPAQFLIVRDPRVGEKNRTGFGHRSRPPQIS